MSQKQQVMVVDDDLAMCGFLRTFLGSRGYTALTVTHADEAVRRFHAERPAAVLLDVVMPGGMDGLAALAAFRKIDKDVPVPTLTMALFTRFRSRQEQSFAEKMLAALRNAFGGHSVRR